MMTAGAPSSAPLGVGLWGPCDQAILHNSDYVHSHCPDNQALTCSARYENVAQGPSASSHLQSSATPQAQAGAMRRELATSTTHPSSLPVVRALPLCGADSPDLWRAAAR